MKKDEIICAMFQILCERASGVEDPRLNNKGFAFRVALRVSSAVCVDEFWGRIEAYFAFIERYCHESGRKSLAALVVDHDGNYPGEWFGKYIAEVKWQYPPTVELEKWYSDKQHNVRQGKRRPKKSGYLWDVRRHWQNLDHAQITKNFRNWLEEQLRPEQREITASDEIRGTDDNVELSEVLERFDYAALENFGYAPDRPEDDRQETLDSFFNSGARSGTPEHLKNMAENLADKVRENGKKAGGKYRADLKYLHDKYYEEYFGFAGRFKWPSTYATPGAGGGFDYPRERGMFSHFGYSTSKSEVDRLDILDGIFHATELPILDNDAENVEEFGAPESPQRLLKIANFLAAMARNFSRMTDKDYSNAIEAWKSDLDYLREEYYRGRFDFAEGYFEWPDLPPLPEKPRPSPKKPMQPKQAKSGGVVPKSRTPATEPTGPTEPEQNHDPVLETAGTDDTPGDDDESTGENTESEDLESRAEPIPAGKEKNTADKEVIIWLLAIAVGAIALATAFAMLLKS